MKEYVLWKEGKNYKLQHTSECLADICNARRIWTLKDFDSVEEVFQWLKENWDIDREEITVQWSEQ